MGEKISRERLFELSKVMNHTLEISFKPGTSGMKNYGKNLLVGIDLNETEFNELARNYLSFPPKQTFGKIRAKAIKRDMLTLQQIEKLCSEGFNTNDISAIRCKKMVN